MPYEAILSFEEAIIREFFPKGVIQVGKGDRWEPAEKKADRTLARLLRDKRDRRERPRYLAASSAHKLRWNKKLKRWEVAPAHPDEDIGYTDVPTLAVKTEGQAVPEEVQKRFSQEARERDALRKDVPLWQKLQSLEADLSDRQKESIRRRIEAARRQAA